jgi:hypothetical protein
MRPLTLHKLSYGRHQPLLLDGGMVDLPNDDQPNTADALFFLGSASIVASIVLGLVWLFSQWWL